MTTGPPGGRPQRTCVGCRRRRPKIELLRVARTPDGVVVVDLADAAPGRGAYVCPDARCAERALRGGGMARALRAPLAATELARLREEMEKELS